MNESPITRGRPLPFVDALGNVLAIPNKLIFLNADFESHALGPEVEEAVRGFLERHDCGPVHVRLNEYDPLGELVRLVRHDRVNPLLRFTVGALSWVAYCLNIGRLFGGDHYNPFTHTVNLYSNSRSIALHELGHALDFHRAHWPGAYALLRMIPILSLWQEYIASRIAVEHLRHTGDQDEELAAYRLLFPAYSTYVFGALLEWFPSSLTRSLALPVIALGHLAGEGFARQRARDEALEDPGRQPDLAEALRQFGPTPDGLQHWGTLIGLTLGSSMCGVLGPPAAWLGFRLGQALGSGVSPDPQGLSAPFSRDP